MEVSILTISDANGILELWKQYNLENQRNEIIEQRAKIKDYRDASKLGMFSHRNNA